MKTVLKKFGGRLVKGETTYDGVQYMYRSVWDSDEEIDEFLEQAQPEVVKSDVDTIDGYLTLFFSTK